MVGWRVAHPALSAGAPPADRIACSLLRRRLRRLARAEAKLTLANIAYNMDRLIFQERRATTA